MLPLKDGRSSQTQECVKVGRNMILGFDFKWVRDIESESRLSNNRRLLWRYQKPQNEHGGEWNRFRSTEWPQGCYCKYHFSEVIGHVTLSCWFLSFRKIKDYTTSPLANITDSSCHHLSRKKLNESNFIIPVGKGYWVYDWLRIHSTNQVTNTAHMNTVK